MSARFARRLNRVSLVYVDSPPLCFTQGKLGAIIRQHPDRCRCRPRASPTAQPTPLPSAAAAAADGVADGVADGPAHRAPDAEPSPVPTQLPTSSRAPGAISYYQSILVLRRAWLSTPSRRGCRPPSRRTCRRRLSLAPRVMCARIAVPAQAHRVCCKAAQGFGLRLELRPGGLSGRRAWWPTSRS